MNYTLVQLYNYPVVCFAHYYGPSEYVFNRSSKAEHYEITFISSGALTRIQNGYKLNIPEYSVQISLPDEGFTQTCETLHGHSTFGFVVKSSQTSISRDELLNKYYMNSANNTTVEKLGKGMYPEFILPDMILPGKDADQIRNMISNIIHTYQTTDIYLRQSITSVMVLSLFASLTQICIKDALMDRDSNIVPMHHQYVKRFKQYVTEHIDENISCEDIADILAITPGYLSSIVKKETGETMIHYINRMKLEKIVELCLVYQIALKQAGEMVGIYDSHYLSRLFKKYYGVSWREYLESRV